MDELRFKVGDKVRVIACKHGHKFEIGTESEISKIYNENSEFEHYEVGGEKGWFCANDELESINDQEDEK